MGVMCFLLVIQMGALQGVPVMGHPVFRLVFVGGWREGKEVG